MITLMNEAAKYIEEFVTLVTEENVDIVFKTSYGLMDSTIKAAKKYPRK